jgi:putative peptide zinc metalloprotease protein
MESTRRNSLWADQEAWVDIPKEATQGLWDLLEEKTTPSSTSPRGGRPGDKFDLWQSLQTHLDLSRRRPKRIDAYEVAHLGVGPDHEYYVLKNIAAHTYLKCTHQDFFLWEMMDGQHTVRDMAVGYSAKFGSFPFERLLNLIGLLGEAGFLEEKPMQVFDTLNQRFEGHSWAQRLNRWADALMHHEFRLLNPDAFFDALYRRVGWILFSRVTWALYIPVTLIGLILFLGEYYTRTDSPLKTGESYGLGILLLLLIGCLVMPIHECAHGLACKYHRREVLGAGAMLYYGSPAFFVDTNDMWLAPKRARIGVSWAGPFSTILIAGICSTVVARLPDWPPSPILFQVALVCYYSALINLNPLLELDGYYILMDYLEIPRLRQKALDFVKGELPKRLFREWRTFSREELIFTVFGLLSALWMATALALGLRFVRIHLRIMLDELQTGRDILSIIVVGIMLLVYGVPLIGGLALKAATSLAAGTKKLFHRVNA